MTVYGVIQVEFYPEDMGCQTVFEVTLPKMFTTEAKAFEYAKQIMQERLVDLSFHNISEEDRKITATCKDNEELGIEYVIQEFELTD